MKKENKICYYGCREVRCERNGIKQKVCAKCYNKIQNGKIQNNG